MPRYLVLCKRCSNNWEVFRLIKDRHDLGKCPKCGCTDTAQDYSDHHGNHVFEKRVFEHLDSYPIEIDSKKALRKACKVRGIDPQRVPALN